MGAAIHDALDDRTKAAFYAACTAYSALVDGSPLVESSWFNPAETEGAIPLVMTAAPFVRAWPDAPTEALFIELRTQSPTLGLEGNWIDLPAEIRTAFEVFRQVLVLVDTLHKANEFARNFVAEERATYPVDDEDRTLQPVDDPFALSDVGRAMERRVGA